MTGVEQYDDPPPQRADLRTRNRLRVRSDIQDAAWELFAARDFAAVTTDEIAAAAGVSPSTYFRHVSSKEALLLEPLFASSSQVVARFDARPPTESVALALSAAITARSGEDSIDDVRRWRAAFRTAPELGGRVSLITETDRAALIAIATRRLGSDQSDLRPGVIVGAVLAAAEYAYRRWLQQDDDAPLLPLMAEALEVVDGL